MNCQVYNSVTGITPSSAILAYLERELGYYHKLYDRRTRRVKHVWCNTYRLDGDTLWIPTGIWPRIQKAMTAANLPFTVQDLRESLPTPYLGHINWAGLRVGQADAIQAIALNHMGVINHPTGLGKSYLIVELCHTYPNSNIIAATKARSVVRTIVQRLLDSGIKPGVMGDGSHTNDRVTVSTYDSLSSCDIANCDLLLGDEVHGAPAHKCSGVIASFPKARRFGFSASLEGRSDGADSVVECLFGPTICTVTYQEGVDANAIVPIEVWLVGCNEGPNEDELPDFQAAADRVAIWCNPDRNARVAQACQYVLGRLGQDQQILVMVEKVRHAFELRKLLPDYAVVYGGMDASDREQLVLRGLMGPDEKPLTDSGRARLQDDFAAGRVKRVIATGVWKEGVDFVDLRILVRADGSAAPIASTQIPGRLSRKAPGKEKGILIDFIDSFHDTYRHRTNKRLAAYRRHGWKLCELPI